MILGSGRPSLKVSGHGVCDGRSVLVVVVVSVVPDDVALRRGILMVWMTMDLRCFNKSRECLATYNSGCERMLAQWHSSNVQWTRLLQLGIEDKVVARQRSTQVLSITLLPRISTLTYFGLTPSQSKIK